MLYHLSMCCAISIMYVDRPILIFNFSLLHSDSTIGSLVEFRILVCIIYEDILAQDYHF